MRISHFRNPNSVWENVSEISGSDCVFAAINAEFTDGMCEWVCVCAVQIIGFYIEVNIYGKCVEKRENDSVVYKRHSPDHSSWMHVLKSMIYTHLNR